MKSTRKTSGEIADIIQHDKNITIPEMAEKLGKTTRNIEMQIAKLKKEGRIRRVGPAKGGYWEVVKGK